MEEPNCVVSGGLAVLLRVSRVAGLAPLTFVREQDGWRVTRSRALWIYGNVLITIIILGNIATMISDSVLGSVFMVTRNDVMVFSVYMSLIMFIVALSGYGSWSQMGKMIASLNKVHQINLDLHRHRQSRNSEERKICLLIFWMIVTFSLISSDLILLTTKPNNEISLMYIFFYILLGVLVLKIFHIHFIVHNILYTFIIINDCIRDLLEVASIQSSSNKRMLSPFNLLRSRNKQIMSSNVVGIAADDPNSKRPDHEIVRDLALAYTKICDVVNDMEKFYGNLLFLLLGFFITQLIVSPYFLVEQFFYDWTVIKTTTFYYSKVATQMCWCIFHMVNLIVLIEPCHWTYAEVITTRGLVSHLMHYTNSVYEPLAMELDVFYRLLMLNQASYSPLKVTTLNRSLVITILSSITTYLVILTQNQ